MAENAYGKRLKEEYGTLIDSLSLDDIQKRFLRSRWLDQVIWMELKCVKTQRWYFIFKIVTIIGGIFVPSLISLKLGNGEISALVNWITFVISLAVAISIGVEGFFRFGERWRHYRRTMEMLKMQAWQFFQLSGPYRSLGSHSAAYSLFAGKVEEIIRNEVEIFITEVVKEKKEEHSGQLTKIARTDP
jgi:hypothetical protein